MNSKIIEQEILKYAFYETYILIVATAQGTLIVTKLYILNHPNKNLSMVLIVEVKKFSIWSH